MKKRVRERIEIKRELRETRMRERASSREREMGGGGGGGGAQGSYYCS